MKLPTPKKANMRTSVERSDTLYPTPHNDKRGRANRLIFTMILILVVLGWMFRSDLGDFLRSPDIETVNRVGDDNGLFVGKDVDLVGEIQRASGSMYTHTLDDITYGVLGLRSAQSLSDLTGVVKLSGRIVQYIDNIYIVEVKTINTGDDIVYFSEPGVLIKNNAKDGFTITQDTIRKIITIENPSTHASILLRYIKCDTTNDIYDCSKIIAGSENTSNPIDAYGVRYYPLADKSSYFADIDKRYGVYIELSQPELFEFAVARLQFINQTWAEQHMKTTAKTYCKSGPVKLTTILSGSLMDSGSMMIWNIYGSDDAARTINCTIVFQPTALEDAKVTATADYELPQETTNNTPTATGNVGIPSTPETTDQVQDNTTLVTDTTTLSSNGVSQFPLKPGKELIFNTRGLIISFPSPNIAYESHNIDAAPNGRSCDVVTYITDYPNKDTLITDPKSAIYFCDKTATTTSASVRTINYSGGKILIEALDPARRDFVNNILLKE